MFPRAFNHKGAILTRIHLFPLSSPKVSLLAINALLPLIAIITVDNVVTGLQGRISPKDAEPNSYF
jgi:hypothetical protein